jgi:hypothetical protein
MVTLQEIDAKFSYQLYQLSFQVQFQAMEHLILKDQNALGAVF